MTLNRKSIATAAAAILLLTACGDPADTPQAAEPTPVVTSTPEVTADLTPEPASTAPFTDASDIAALGAAFPTLEPEEEPENDEDKESESEATNQPSQSNNQTTPPKSSNGTSTPPKQTQTQAPKAQPKPTKTSSAPKPQPKPTTQAPKPKPTKSTPPPPSKPEKKVIKNWGTVSGETADLEAYRKGLGLNLELGPNCFPHGSVKSLNGASGIIGSTAHRNLISGHRTKLVNARSSVEDRGIDEDGFHRFHDMYTVDIHVCPPAS